jgi:predicted phage baseplate assembly protein
MRAASPIVQNGVTLAYAVKLVNALSNGYDASATSVYANIAAATQGKTQPMEVLGSGDASKPWQEFALRSNPVAYIASAAAASGAASTLRVFVNNVQWNEVESFYGNGPNDQIFVTRVGDDGTYYVRFGDGITGQRVPTGNRNVTALYRTGAGSSGNVEAAGISTILQAVTCLQSVTNPLPAVGGGDGEAIDRTRQNAPVSVLTLGRAVSLRDYEALALTYRNGIVTKVRASWADLGDRRGVALTAAAGAQPLGQLAQPLRDFLDQHRDPNVPLTIADIAVVCFIFRAIVYVQAGNPQSVVKSAVEAALGVSGDAGYLSYAQLDIGESIYQSKLLAALQSAAGVEWVQLQEFSTAYSFGRTGFSPNGNAGPSPFPLGPPGVGHKKLDVIYINPKQIAQPSLSGLANDRSVDLTFSGGVNDL